MVALSDERQVYYLIGLPKTLGRNLYRTLLGMQPRRGGVELAVPPTPQAFTHGIGIAVAGEVPGTFLDTAQKCLIHSHAYPLPLSAMILRKYQVRHLVLVRHPADQLTAMYCHLRRILHQSGAIGEQLPPATTAEPERYSRLRGKAPDWHWVVHPVHQPLFTNTVSVEDSLQHMIEDGYLQGVLSWVSSWQKFADPKLTRVIRYEDLIAEPIRQTRKAYRFLWDSEPAENGDPSLTHSANAAHTGIYPHGPTAGQGVWRNYFSNRNIESYNAIVKKCLGIYGGDIKNLYGDVFL